MVCSLKKKKITSVATYHVDYLSKSAPNAKDVGIELPLPQNDMYKYTISFKCAVTNQTKDKKIMKDKCSPIKAFRGKATPRIT